jgi:hypothetical protein
VRGLVTLASLLVLAAPRVASAEERVPRVGVVIELTVNVDATRADAIGKSLADALTRTLEVDAFGGGDVSRRLPAEGLPEECLGNPGCITDIAARLDADQLLFLALAQIGSELQIDASWVDIASGQVTARPRLVLPDDTKSFQTFLEQAPRYLPDAPVRAPKTGDGGSLPTRTVPAVPRHMTTASWITAGATIGFAGLGAAVDLHPLRGDRVLRGGARRSGAARPVRRHLVRGGGGRRGGHRDPVPAVRLAGHRGGDHADRGRRGPRGGRPLVTR